MTEVRELQRQHPKLVQEVHDWKQRCLEKDRMIERLKRSLHMLQNNSDKTKHSAGPVSAFASSSAFDDDGEDRTNQYPMHRKRYGDASTSHSTKCVTSASSAFAFSSGTKTTAAVEAAFINASNKKRSASSISTSSSMRPQRSVLDALNSASKVTKAAKIAQQRRTLLHEGGTFRGTADKSNHTNRRK
eukprot:13510999-Ditylum_brightwellii.AAC.1